MRRVWIVLGMVSILTSCSADRSPRALTVPSATTPSTQQRPGISRDEALAEVLSLLVAGSPCESEPAAGHPVDAGEILLRELGLGPRADRCAP
jgi:hypothetical protein